LVSFQLKQPLKWSTRRYQRHLICLRPVNFAISWEKDRFQAGLVNSSC
jgi:hypothetical protein